MYRTTIMPSRHRVAHHLDSPPPPADAESPFPVDHREGAELWPEPGSNWRPSTFQADALPTELSGRRLSQKTISATLTGLEPATSAVTGRRANQLRHRALLLCAPDCSVATRCNITQSRITKTNHQLREHFSDHPNISAGHAESPRLFQGNNRGPCHLRP